MTQYAPDNSAARARNRDTHVRRARIRRHIIWRNKYAADERLREVVNGENVA